MLTLSCKAQSKQLCPGSVGHGGPGGPCDVTASCPAPPPQRDASMARAQGAFMNGPSVKFLPCQQPLLSLLVTPLFVGNAQDENVHCLLTGGLISPKEAGVHKGAPGLLENLWTPTRGHGECRPTGRGKRWDGLRGVRGWHELRASVVGVG